jgi:phosphonate transport system substrate-binding protein
MRYLEERIGVRFELVIPRSIENHIDVVRRGEVSFSYHNPFVLLEVWNEVIPLAVATRNKGLIECQGMVIAKTGGVVSEIGDLAGKTLSVASTHEASGFVIVERLLGAYGLNAGQDVRVIEAKGNKQQNVIHDVLGRKAEAGVIDEGILEGIEGEGLLAPGEVEDLVVVGRTDKIPNWVFCADKGLPGRMTKKVRKALVQISPGAPVLTAAKIEGFVTAPQDYFENFRRSVRSE